MFGCGWWDEFGWECEESISEQSSAEVALGAPMVGQCGDFRLGSAAAFRSTFAWVDHHPTVQLAAFVRARVSRKFDAQRTAIGAAGARVVIDAAERVPVHDRPIDWRVRARVSSILVPIADL